MARVPTLEPRCSEPTARQFPGDAHDTETSWRYEPLPNFGAGTERSAHTWPFQVSAMSAAPVLPTATQALADVHDTDEREASFKAGGLSIAHLPCVHCSATGVGTPAVYRWPTATHHVPVGHETPFTSIDPVVFGVACTDHVGPARAAAPINTAANPPESAFTSPPRVANPSRLL